MPRSRRALLISCLLALAAPPLRTARGQCEREWAPVSGLPGFDGTIYAMVVFNDGTGDALYLGGSFRISGDNVVSYIAKWDGTSFSHVGTGMNGNVTHLVVFDDGSGAALYAMGKFTIAGDAPANRIAKWDGTSWSPVGSGFNQNDGLYALAPVDAGDAQGLYIGGIFSTTGGVSASNIAKWNGSSWSALGSGMDGSVQFLLVQDDGDGPALYAAGGFSTAGGVSADRIAKWDGSSWSALGSGNIGPLGGYSGILGIFDDGGGPTVYALSTVYLSPSSPPDHEIHKWLMESEAWTSVMGPPLSASPRLIVVDDDIGPVLYVDNGYSLLRWDGPPGDWFYLGAGNRDVYAVATFDDGSGPALYAAGDEFAQSNPGSPEIWSTIWPPLGGSIFALSTFDDGRGPALYAGFGTRDFPYADRIAKWDGSSWWTLGSGWGGDIGNNIRIEAFAVFDDGGGPALFTGGEFETAAGVPANSIARWDGMSWSALGSGVSRFVLPTVRGLTVFDDGGGPALYAVGYFTSAGGVSANNVAKWDGSGWSALGAGIGGLHADVNSVTVFDDAEGPALYAGGDFTTAGGVNAKNIAKWDGASWTALGSGLEGGSIPSVLALAVFDDGDGPALFAAGRFSTAGGMSANNIAKWDGSSWSPLGSGMNSGVSALTVFDDGGGPALYAGGSFTTAGGMPANRIAKWDGLSWTAFGSGTDGPVYSLTVHDDGSGTTLFAGGDFSLTGGLVSDRIAKWACARRGDMNQDSVIGLSDFELFFYCLGGPSQSMEAWACDLADVDYDHHIDLWDFATLQQAFGE